METFSALLFDSRSIQKYIFAGNELRTNIGASYLVKSIFDKILVEVLMDEFGFTIPDFRTNNEFKILQDPSVKCEIAYIGGGNALVLLRQGLEKNLEKDIVKAFTKKLLVEAPGLKTGVAIGQIRMAAKQDADTANQFFMQDLNNLRAELRQKQNEVFPNVDLPCTGLTQECPVSGGAALFKDSVNKSSVKKRYVSAETKMKQNAVQSAYDELLNTFRNVVPDNFKFIEYEIDKLGQKDGEEYITIVHVDGNDMGTKFRNCKSPQQYRKLSNEVKEKSEEAFKELLSVIVQEYPYYEKKKLLSDSALKEKIIPLRPIIFGGDDITFVCPGKMGLIYAKKLLELLQKQELEIPGLGKQPFTACAGVAILPTKYPFFRGYQLAEQLCDSAKVASRNNDHSSWLDFALLHGEQAPDWAEIKESEYKAVQGNLHFGPYRIAHIEITKSIARLLLGSQILAKMPRSKVKELRDVIGKGEAEIVAFIQQLKMLDEAGTKVKYTELLQGGGLFEHYSKKLWDNGETPYLDMIEVMDFVYDEAEAQEEMK